MLKMVDGTGIIGVDMVCPLGGTVSPPQPPNFDKVEMEGVGRLMLPNSLKAPLERVELIGNSVQGENPAPDNPQEIKNVGKWNEETQKYEVDVKVTGKNLFDSRYASNPFNWVDSGDGFKTLNKPLITNGEEYTISSIKLLPKGLGFNFLISESFERLSVKHYYFYHNGNSPAIKDRVTVRGSDNLYLKMTGDFDSFASNLLNILQFEKGGNKTAYESYTEQTLILTSDRPITKWDKLVKQGGEYGWLYQSAVDTDVKPSRLDLFPNGFSLFKDFGNGVYVYKVTNIKKAIGFQTSLCEQFKNKDGSYSTGDLFCYSDQPSMQMQYFATDIPTLEEFKTWMETNPLTMVYKTTESHFIPLPESVQQQLQALHSENGTTHVFVDSGEVPCGIKLTYRKEI